MTFKEKVAVQALLIVAQLCVGWSMESRIKELAAEIRAFRAEETK